MGNSQFNSAKDGEGGSGREGEGYDGYSGTRTAPGAPGPFSVAGFAPPLRGADGKAAYPAGGAAVPGVEADSRGTPAVGDDMDIEAKPVDEGEEEEVRSQEGEERKEIFCTLNNVKNNETE